MSNGLLFLTTALRRGILQYATDLTDEQWAAIRAARRHPVAQRRAPDQDRSPGDRQRAAL